MNDKDFTDKIQFTKEISNTGRIKHRAKLEFYVEYFQDREMHSKSSAERAEEAIRDKMTVMIHREIYEDRRFVLSEAISKLMSCVEPFFLPSEKLMEARNEVLKAAGFKAGNRLAVGKDIPYVPYKGPDCTTGNNIEYIRDESSFCGLYKTTTPITFRSYDGTKSTLPVNTLPDNE
jgi:hypothetical protein